MVEMNELSKDFPIIATISVGSKDANQLISEVLRIYSVEQDIEMFLYSYRLKIEETAEYEIYSYVSNKSGASIQEGQYINMTDYKNIRDSVLALGYELITWEILLHLGLILKREESGAIFPMIELLEDEASYKVIPYYFNQKLQLASVKENITQTGGLSNSIVQLSNWVFCKRRDNVNY